MSDENKKDIEKKDAPTEKDNKGVLKIPLRLIPNETESFEAEMQEIFDEDKIVHRHGSSEPERD